MTLGRKNQMRTVEGMVEIIFFVRRFIGNVRVWCPVRVINTTNISLSLLKGVRESSLC